LPPTRRLGSADEEESKPLRVSEEMSVKFSKDGFVADDDAFEAGLVVDDPVFSEEFEIYDPEPSHKWLKLLGFSAAVLLLVGGAVYVYKRFQGDKEDNTYKQHEYTTTFGS